MADVGGASMSAEDFGELEKLAAGAQSVVNELLTPVGDADDRATAVTAVGGALFVVASKPSNVLSSFLRCRRDHPAQGRTRGIRPARCSSRRSAMATRRSLCGRRWFGECVRRGGDDGFHAGRQQPGDN